MADSARKSWSADTIEAGQVWRVKKTGERWEVLEADFDGPATYRVVLLDAAGERTQTRDTVWGSEIRDDAERICVGCEGVLEDDQPGPGCESSVRADGSPDYGPCDGREL